MSEYNNIPWVEKYRPYNLNNIVAHNDIVNTLNNMIDSNRFPHIIWTTWYRKNIINNGMC